MSEHVRLGLLAVLAAVTGWGCACADPAKRLVETEHVAVELIAGAGAPSPAGEIWLGVRFRLRPGWHLYWQNPGDAGIPPSVRWSLPAGLRAGALQWPAPERFATDGLASYGYSGDVVLPVLLTGSPEWWARPTSVEADVKWLICRDVCIPGKAQLALSFPLSGEEPGLTAWKGQIREALERVPRRAPPAWKTAAASRKDAFVLSVELNQPAP